MKAKYLFMVGLLALSSHAMQAKTMNQFMRELSKQENVTRLSVGPLVMKIGSLFTETMGVNSVNIFCLEDCSSETLDKFNAELRDLEDPDFEPLVTSNEDGERTKILVKVKDDMIREMVICHVDDEVAVIHLKGKIKPEDIAQVINDHKNDR